MMNSPSITLWSLAAASVAVMLLRLVWLRRTTRQGHAYQQRRTQRDDAVMSQAEHWYRRGTDAPDDDADQRLRDVASNADTVPLGNLTPEQEARFLRRVSDVVRGGVR